MRRKRITELFPFLIPLRQKQRKFCFYLLMRFDKHKYARTKETVKLPYVLYEAKSQLLNYNSGHDMEFQHNKVHNLKIATEPMKGIMIRPGETFSFWNIVKDADREVPYKDGLSFVNGQIVGVNGGGLCQLSNLLFWVFLHTPLTIIERYPHAVKSFPAPPSDIPEGTDATVSEGWRDLKMKNETGASFQIELEFDQEFLHCRIRTDQEFSYHFEIEGRGLCYERKGNKIYQTTVIYQKKIDRRCIEIGERFLYQNRCEIGYELPEDKQIEGE